MIRLRTLAALATVVLAGCTGILGSYEVQGGPSTTPDGGGSLPDAATTDAGAEAAAPFSITVNKTGPGQGLVSSAPAGITCGPTCSSAFAPGTVVTLTATPNPPSTFSGWSGACSGAGPCVVTVDKAVSVGAAFAVPMRKLTVTKEGKGDGMVRSTPNGIACGPNCTGDFPQGAVVKLAAEADANSGFVGWGGDATSCARAPTCDITIPAGPTNVTAEFAPLATWDPNWSLAGVTYSNGDRDISGNSAGTKNVRTTVGRASGRFYWEIKATGGSAATNYGGLGIVESVMPNNATYIGYVPSGLSFGYGSNPTYYMSWAGATTHGSPPAASYVAAGIVYMFALDMNTGTLWAGQDGTWYNSGNPAAGTNPAATGLSGTVYPGVTFYNASTNAFSANFGQQAFIYPAPIGFSRGFY